MPRRKQITTHTGHKLSIKEDKFINLYLETGNGSESVVRSGYTTKHARVYAQTLLTKPYIAEEIKFRRDQAYAESQATAAEVMDYFTKVMRGEIKDQFGLEAPLSERTKAAQELAKRTIDIDNRLAGKKDMSTPEVTIKLDWNREEKNNDEEKT